MTNKEKILKYNSKFNPQIIADFLEGRLLDPSNCSIYPVGFDLIDKKKNIATLELRFYPQDNKKILFTVRPTKLYNSPTSPLVFLEATIEDIKEIMFENYGFGSKIVRFKKKKNIKGGVTLSKGKIFDYGYQLNIS